MVKNCKWAQTQYALKKHTVERLTKIFKETAKVGFEIESDYGVMSCGFNSPRECGVCDDCVVCDRCTEGDIYCNSCSHFVCKDGNIPCRYNDGGYCNYFEREICNMCIENCTRCEDCFPCESCDELSDVDVDDVNRRVANDLGCESGHLDYDPSKKDYQFVYNDGSVSTEVVTTALKLNEVYPILTKAYVVLDRYNCKISPEAKAGGHQTVSFAKPFPIIVVKNVIQLVRYYYPALLAIGCIKGSHNREGGNDYRCYPSSGVDLYHGRNHKYLAVHIKRSTSFPKLIEFRYPDSHTNINQCILTALINIALVAKAITLSQYGVFVIDENHLTKAKTNTTQFYGDDSFVDVSWVRDLGREMLEDLQKEINYFGVYDLTNEYPKQSVRCAVEEIINHNDCSMSNNMDIKEVYLR